MSWKEYNGGDEAEWWHLVILFLGLIGFFVWIFLFKPSGLEIE